MFEETEASRDGGPLAGKLTDLSLDPSFDFAKNEGEHAAVRGEIIGASEDGSYVYFVANGVLGDAGEHGASPGNCVNEQKPGGTCSLYVEHFDGGGWEEPEFIATLSGEDFPDWAVEADSSGLTARVSPNGRWLAFMSDRSLTGYDNTDVHSGAADEEVYLFHAGSGGAGSLACASCNPAGQRPEGVFEPAEGEEKPGFHYLLVDQPERWGGRWLAGSVPGWTANEPADGVLPVALPVEQRPAVLQQPRSAGSRRWQPHGERV